ncbi:MAG: L,D-transpeptidase family protein [Syntrophaceae bacterium]
MNRLISMAVITGVIFLFVFAELTYAENLSDLVRKHIGERIMTAEHSSNINCGDILLCRSSLLPRVYSEREYRPAWSDDYGPFPHVEDFLEVLRKADQEGLNPKEYHLSEIEAGLSGLYESLMKGETPDCGKIADIDLMLTDAFLLYASHMAMGRVDHRKIYPNWVVKPRSTDVTAMYQRVIASGEIEKELAGLPPHYPGYIKLKEKLSEYRNIAENGGWPRIPQGAKLYRGAHGKQVAALRKRLILSGYLKSMGGKKSNIFNREIEAAVRIFQKSHGLKDDGRVGRPTLEALNVTVEKRIRQIALNMDRMRWLPSDIGKRFIFVNVADFRLQITEDEHPIMDMKIIAGKKEQRSCVLSAKMKYLELNPFWKVPDSIATKEILPQVKKNTGYLKNRNIRVFWNWNDNAKEIDPRKINWSRVMAKNFKYKLRQDPGPGNPLGRVKFIFPNACDIYLHDTPTRHLFGREHRAFSHGCIRIEKPVELATYLLQNKETWTRKKILAEIKKGKRQVVTLPEPMNVHIFYGTAWVDRNGLLQFRNDIYHIDEIPYEVPIVRARAAVTAR